MSHSNADCEHRNGRTCIRHPIERSGSDCCYSTTKDPRPFTERSNTSYGECSTAPFHAIGPTQPSTRYNDNRSLIQQPDEDTDEEDQAREQTTDRYGRYEAQQPEINYSERQGLGTGTSRRNALGDGYGTPSRSRLDRRHTDGPSLRAYVQPQFEDYVRCPSHRRTSHGRALFSPSALKDSQVHTSQNGQSFPLLPIPELDPTIPLSRAAAGFAAIHSGDFQACIKYLKRHEELLDEAQGWYLQEAWKAMWDRELDRGIARSLLSSIFDRQGDYAHQCLSRWFLLDECTGMDPGEIDNHINSRHFKPKDFWNQVNSMYNTLKMLRLSLTQGTEQRIRTPDGSMTMRGGGALLPPEARQIFATIDHAKVLGNIGKAYRLARDLRNELREASEQGRI